MSVCVECNKQPPKKYIYFSKILKEQYKDYKTELKKLFRKQAAPLCPPCYFTFKHCEECFMALTDKASLLDSSARPYVMNHSNLCEGCIPPPEMRWEPYELDVAEILEEDVMDFIKNNKIRSLYVKDEYPHIFIRDNKYIGYKPVSEGSVSMKEIKEFKKQFDYL